MTPDAAASTAVVFEALFEDVEVPVRSTEESAGYDVRAYLKGGPIRVFRGATGSIGKELPEVADDLWRLVLQPGDRALVPTGFKARLPSGYEAQIRMRSSLAWKRGLIVPNAPGTVDADYPHEWFVLVLNAAPQPIEIEHGERIAQIVLNRYEVVGWERGDVGVSTDRRGGLGSTGAR